MNELVKALRVFISRDLLYVIGGSSVLASFLYLFDRLPSSDQPLPVYLFLGGLGYVTGYAAQDGLGLTGFVTTRNVSKPPGIIQWFYRRFTGYEWTEIPKEADLQKGTMALIEDAPERVMAEFQRIITLKHVGTTMGANGLFVAVFLGLRWWAHDELFDLCVAISTFLLAVILIILGWLKSAQQSAFVMAYNYHGSSGEK